MAKLPQPPPTVRPGYEGSDAVIQSPIPLLLPGGGLTILSGASGVGKTAFVAGLAKTIIDGAGAVLGCQVQRAAKVGLLCTDRRWTEARYWYEKAGIEIESHDGQGKKFSYYCLQDDYKTEWKKFTRAEHHLWLFERCLDQLELPPHSVVIGDPISPFLGSNLGDYCKTLAAIGPINQALAKRQITGLGLHHVAKMKGGVKREFYVRGQDRILGSTAIAAFTNTQIYLVGPEENEKPKTELWHTVGFVPHNAKSFEARFGRDENGLFIPWKEASPQAQIVPIEGSSDELATLLASFPEFTPIRIEVLKEKNPVAKSTLYHRLGVLAKQKLIYKQSNGLWRRGQPEPKEEEEAAIHE